MGQSAGGYHNSISVSREEKHIIFWDDVIPEIDSWQFLKSSARDAILLSDLIPKILRPPSQDGWMATVCGVKHLWNTMKKMASVTYRQGHVTSIHLNTYLALLELIVVLATTQQLVSFKQLLRQLLIMVSLSVILKVQTVERMMTLVRYSAICTRRVPFGRTRMLLTSCVMSGLPSGVLEAVYFYCCVIDVSLLSLQI